MDTFEVVDLHPDLVPYLEKGGPLGTSLKHPLHFSSLKHPLHFSIIHIGICSVVSGPTQKTFGRTLAWAAHRGSEENERRKAGCMKRSINVVKRSDVKSVAKKSVGSGKNHRAKSDDGLAWMCGLIGGILYLFFGH